MGGSEKERESGRESGGVRERERECRKKGGKSKRKKKKKRFLTG